MKRDGGSGGTDDGGGPGLGDAGFDGGLGDGGSGDDAGIPPLPPSPSLLATGDAHSCAASLGGAVRCWGNNDYGQLGVGNTEHLGDQPGEMPPPDAEVGAAVIELVAGGAHVCARTAAGAVRCWGFNDYGQLGLGNASYIGDEPGEMPPNDVDVGGPVVQLVAGGLHTCALLDTGAVRCWGGNDYGQLGQGHFDYIGDEPGEMPPPDVPLGGPATYLFAGYEHTCARMATGALRCWGNNESGQLGYGTTDSVGDEPGEMPPADVLVGGIVADGAAGGSHTCVLLTTGAVRCWGDNRNFQLGDPTSETLGDEPGEMPPPDVALGSMISRIVGGQSFTCALTGGGKVRCWGLNSSGQCAAGVASHVGDAPGEMPPLDVVVGGDSIVREIDAGYSHVCVRLVSGAIRCWGSGISGALGSGSTDTIGRDQTPASQPDVSVF